MKRKNCIAIAALLTIIATAGASGDAPTAREPSLPGATAAVSAAVPLVSSSLVFSGLFIPQLQGATPWIANPLLLATHVPMYWLNASRAGWYTGAGIILPAAGISMIFASGESPVLGELSASILGVYSNLMHLSAYDVSVTGRAMLPSDSPGYIPGDDGRVQPGRLTRLVAAPFSKTIIDPIVWIPSLLGPAVLTGYYALYETEDAVSVGESGHGYIGATEVHPVLAGGYALAKGGIDMLAVAAGEEAYFRGVIYDSLQRRTGRVAAMVFDAILFPLIHLPTDIQSNFKTQTILFNFVWRSSMTLVFDMAYDKGGLPLAISTHFWSDLVLVMSRWWFYGGAR